MENQKTQQGAKRKPRIIELLEKDIESVQRRLKKKRAEVVALERSEKILIRKLANKLRAF